MDHTLIVTATELEEYANRRGRDSEAVIPELICMLVKESAPDLTACRIPYGDEINQPGWDGLVETADGFRQFVPKDKSLWEMTTARDPQDTATKYFKDRTEKMSLEERAKATFVFVTPRSKGSAGWNEPQQTAWLGARKDSGWQAIRIMDGVVLADWLREYPAIAKWLLKKMGLVKSTVGLSAPAEHWENLQQLVRCGDPPLPHKVFLVGRDQACRELQRLFKGETRQLAFAVESELDAEDFVAAFLASLEPETGRLLANRCLFLSDVEAWLSMANLRTAHVLVAHPGLDLEATGEQLHMAAMKRGHAVIIPVSGMWAGGADSLIPLRSPSASVLEITLTESGYKHDRARELAAAGALNLAALKRYLRGLGELPPYATWENARLLAQAGLVGRWAGENPADRAAVETIVGKTYGEWIEIVRPETLRSDTPLIQRNENWKMLSRGEAWSALGPRLFNDDLDRFQKAALSVLGERDPKFELPKEEHFMASIKGKALRHSPSLRKGMSETLALLGSRPTALSSCSQHKAELVATLTVRELLKNADWIIWASLNHQLPMLAEAAPDEFLDAVEAALSQPADSPFKTVFAQEGSGIMGWNHMTGLLWALETLAWHPHYLTRVTILLGELAAIDPGGNWANRPANSLTDIFLPWHPQTCAPIPKRKSAVETLLREQPQVGWKLLLTLLPHSHEVTSGCQKPAWRDFIPAGWTENVTWPEYGEQVSGYAELAVGAAAAAPSKLAELIDALPDLPGPPQSRVLEHLTSDTVLGLPESERLPLWEALVDLAAKHRNFADAQWAMQPDAVVKIEETAAKLAPKSSGLLHRRLFSNRDFELYDKLGDFAEQEQRLELRRQEAVQQILKENQLAGVLELAKSAASPYKVGHSLGCVEFQSADTALLPGYLGTEQQVSPAFMQGFVWGRFWTRRWPWVDSVTTSAWTLQQKVAFLTLLPFMPETWQRGETLLGTDVPLYWKNAKVNPYGLKEHLQEATQKLLQHNRPWAAVACLYVLIHEKVPFPPNLAERALMDGRTTEQKSDVLDQHQVLDVIKWLQANSEADPNALFQIEWAYLRLLDHHLDAAPKTLERRLADDPRFFCELIGLIFRSDKEERTDRQPTEQERNIAQNAYRLLGEWQTVPGVTVKGPFDGVAFGKWLAEVKERTKESGHLAIAMGQVGKVFPYAPPDPDGLWIHHSVAKALDAKDADRMRSGFTCELYNMRGVHGDTGGKAERAIAAGYHEKADALEQKGYHRAATAVRELAKGYEREAEREAKQDPFED